MAVQEMNFKQQVTLGAIIGSTSTLALVAATTDAQAEGLYAGLSLGYAAGDVPVLADGDGDNYELSGPVGGVFIGYDSMSSSGLMFGGEIALSGSTEGDPDDEADYEYSYDVNWNLDAKLKVGTMVADKIRVYGFGGLTWGNANNYYRDYQYSGANVGIGAQYDITDDFFVGVEAIHREINGYGSDEANEFGSSHQTLNIRGGFRF